MQYFGQIWFLSLANNHIADICDSFLEEINKSENIRWLNLKSNNLARIPRKIEELKFLDKLWLSENPFRCDCEMTWMIGWVNNFTSSGDRIIADYKGLKCHSGLTIGQPIYQLNEVEMGCYPAKLTLWQKITIGISSGLGCTIIIWLTSLVIKRSRNIRFFFYYYFKWCACFGVPRDDEHEKLDNMLYDAYLSYR